jgi:putative endonuclease
VAKHTILGKEGEARASAYLQRRGYRILGRNVRSGGVEIDIVASLPQLLVFVEVKTRSSQRAGAPEESVDARKCARIVQGARSWLYEQPRSFPRVRFDVIACELDEDQHWHIRHIPAAFDASD